MIKTSTKLLVRVKMRLSIIRFNDYVPGVKGFAPGYIRIGPFRTKQEKKLNVFKPLEIIPKQEKLNSLNPVTKYNEEMRLLRLQYSNESRSQLENQVETVAKDNVNGLAGPKRYRKQILLKYPEENMSALRRNALAIEILFAERLKVLKKQRDDLMLKYKQVDDNGKCFLSDENRIKIKSLLEAQIGTAPLFLNTHLQTEYNMEEQLFSDLDSPKWSKLNAMERKATKVTTPELNEKRLTGLLTLFHASADFITPSNMDDKVEIFVKGLFDENGKFKRKSAFEQVELGKEKNLAELMSEIIEHGVIPEKIDNRTGGVDNMALKYKSKSYNNQALNLFQDETLHQGHNLASISAHTPDTADIIDTKSNLQEPNVSSSPSSAPLLRQREPRQEKYAPSEVEVDMRRLANTTDGSIPSYTMTKEDMGFVALKDGDKESFEHSRESELIDAYRGTLNGKFGVKEVLEIMK